MLRQHEQYLLIYICLSMAVCLAGTGFNAIICNNAQNITLMTYEESDRMLLPMRDAVEIIKGKWKIPIILMLNAGGMRYKELILTVSGISSKVLSKELQDLERNHLIEKKIIVSAPPIQEYGLTPHGKSLVPLIEEIRKWGQMHRRVIIGD